LLAALSVTPAFAQNEEARTNPSWITRPSGADFAQFYPPAAMEQGVVGFAQLMCTVKLDTTTTCAVTYESPEGWGFGEAALGISQSFRMAPSTQDGVAVAGGLASVPIRFATHVSGEETRDWGVVLPQWEAAPNLERVNAVYPLRARAQSVRGRATLSCTVDEDRTLSCDVVRETPEGAGFGAAALVLASEFRVWEQETSFVSQHREAPFFLPVNFGAPPLQEPLSTLTTGMGVAYIGSSEATNFTFPAAAHAAGVAGRVISLCTLRESFPAHCIVESEEPIGWGFGEAVASRAHNNNFAPQTLGLLPGDQIRVETTFTPQT